MKTILKVLLYAVSAFLIGFLSFLWFIYGDALLIGLFAILCAITAMLLLVRYLRAVRLKRKQRETSWKHRLVNLGDYNYN